MKRLNLRLTDSEYTTITTVAELLEISTNDLMRNVLTSFVEATSTSLPSVQGALTGGRSRNLAALDMLRAQADYYESQALLMRRSYEHASSLLQGGSGVITESVEEAAAV